VTGLPDRELRLRRRIDQLIDERDAARARVERNQAQLRRLRNRIAGLERSRAMWRNRARQWASR
jgi:hypothetical protein